MIDVNDTLPVTAYNQGYIKFTAPSSVTVQHGVGVMNVTAQDTILVAPSGFVAQSHMTSGYYGLIGTTNVKLTKP